MIVWGGYSGPWLNTGGIYDPELDTWTPTSTEGAPTRRTGHYAVWTGRKMIIWGGHEQTNYVGVYKGSGSQYDPVTDSWAPTSGINAPTMRNFQEAYSFYRPTVWTGSQMIIWGGKNRTTTFGDGAMFTPDPVSSCSGDCYQEGSSPLYAQDLPIGTERQGPDSTTLTLQYANGSSGFKIWKERGGSRILNATGLVANGWQKQLVRRGDSFSATDFTTEANIAGRVCPTHVFLSHSTMTATGRCLYYDGGNAAQLLNSDGGTETEDWLQDWNRVASGKGILGSYYEGNIKTCSDKGMRLPTMYESTMDKPLSNLPTGDSLSSDPTWAGSTNGVPEAPGGVRSWTASGAGLTFHYWVWSGANSAGYYFGHTTGPLTVRCVLP